METRNVTLTLERAKEFYNSGNAALKEVALQAFTEEELETPKFTDIITFGDAVKALSLNDCNVQKDLEKFNNYRFEDNTSEHLKAIYKLDIIRKALNKDWNPSLMEGSVYYPFVRIYSNDKDAKKVAAANGWMFGPTFIADNKMYTLVGGDSDSYYTGGIANFELGFGIVYPHLGLLSCKSREIAEHMSRYFAKEIFEANYAQYIGAYEWVDGVW